MIRRIAAALALVAGLSAPALLTAPDAGAVGTVHTLINGGCTVKVGFNSRSAWFQVWSSGCAFVDLDVSDYSCWCWARSGASAVDYRGIPFGTFRQTGVINANVYGTLTSSCSTKGAYYAYLYTRSTSGYVRDGTVSVWGSRTGW